MKKVYSKGDTIKLFFIVLLMGSCLCNDQPIIKTTYKKNDDGQLIYIRSLLEISGKSVGNIETACMNVNKNLYESKNFEIAENIRRRGLGFILALEHMATFFSESKKAHKQKIIWVSSQEAISFYKRFGALHIREINAHKQLCSQYIKAVEALYDPYFTQRANNIKNVPEHEYNRLFYFDQSLFIKFLSKNKAYLSESYMLSSSLQNFLKCHKIKFYSENNIDFLDVLTQKIVPKL